MGSNIPSKQVFMNKQICEQILNRQSFWLCYKGTLKSEITGEFYHQKDMPNIYPELLHPVHSPQECLGWVVYGWKPE